VTLLQTNNFPEFTGRCCPAPCEVSESHDLAITTSAVTRLVDWLIDWRVCKVDLYGTLCVMLICKPVTYYLFGALVDLCHNTDIAMTSR